MDSDKLLIAMIFMIHGKIAEALIKRQSKIPENREVLNTPWGGFLFVIATPIMIKDSLGFHPLVFLMFLFVYINFLYIIIKCFLLKVDSMLFYFISANWMVLLWLTAGLVGFSNLNLVMAPISIPILGVWIAYYMRP